MPERRAELRLHDRFLAWLVTGAPGRAIAFAIDLGAAVLRAGAARVGRGLTRRR